MKTQVRERRASYVVPAALLAALVAAACGSDTKDDTNNGNFNQDPSGPSSPSAEGRDPYSCQEAKSSKSYVGCDYWPTMTPNVVANSFDFVVVAANTGTLEAKVAVTGPNGTNKDVSIPAGGLVKIPLPWVPDLKGPAFDQFDLPPSPGTAIVSNGAYHLVSTSPIIVYQFNPLRFEAADKSKCNGDVHCMNSYSADASLLLPSTAMRTTYRVTGMAGNVGGASVLSVTATAPQTKVTIELSSTGKIKASTSGTSVADANAGSTVTLTLANAGDVAQLVTPDDESVDFSGSVVRSNNPVQVIASVPCANMPGHVGTCDHLEETVMPAETFGKQYVIGRPTHHDGNAAVHVVRIYGNENGTKLDYQPSKPSNCPDTVDAGKFYDCGIVDQSFVVNGSAPFGVASFLVGSSYFGANNTMGDPSQTTYPSIEQFRKRYVFLAPTDYPVRFADVTAREGTTLKLDGNAVSVPWEKIGSGPFGIYRVPLPSTSNGGAYTIEATNPIAVQVLGYAYATSFEYPAGLNLDLIAPDIPVK